jgi:DNA-binding LacI/PurR family transcriptional regulator
MTVSNAYNRPDQISEQTRERVLRVARELGYAGPDPAARSLRRGRAGTVGVLLTEQLPYAFADPGMLTFLHGLATELGAAGQALLLVPAESNADHQLVRNAMVDGFVLASLSRADPAVDDVLSRRLPVVTWGHPKLPGVPRVGIDNARAVSELAQYLLDLGHRRFGIVTFGVHAPTASVSQRVSGFQRALADAGIAADDVTVVTAAVNSRPTGAAAAEALLAAEATRRPTAVFGVTDIIALGVLDAAAKAGLAVPEQLSVVGFDDIAEASASSPALTTVSQSLFDQGRTAARVMIDLLAGRRPVMPRITTQLIVRASTAPASNGRAKDPRKV